MKSATGFSADDGQVATAGFEGDRVMFVDHETRRPVWYRALWTRGRRVRAMDKAAAIDEFYPSPEPGCRCTGGLPEVVRVHDTAADPDGYHTFRQSERRKLLVRDGFDALPDSSGRHLEYLPREVVGSRQGELAAGVSVMRKSLMPVTDGALLREGS